MSVKGCLPECDPEEERIVRRLGWAVIKQFEQLRSAEQDSLVRQSGRLGDKVDQEQLLGEIKTLVRKYNANSVF